MNDIADTKFRKRFLVALLGYIVIYKIFDALTIQTHSDPFYYHLAGARIIFYQGWKTLLTDLQGYAQAGWYDLLYILPFYFTKNLIAIQLICQETHLFFSLFLGALFFWKWIPNRTMAILGAIALITISRDFAFFMYAKNDGVVALLTLVTAFWIQKRRDPVWVGIGLGLIPSVKMSGLISTAVLSLIYAVHERRHPSRILKCAAISVAVLIPILVRNYWMTGDPLFPGMVDHFSNKLSISTRDYYHFFFSQPATRESILNSLVDLALGKVVYWIGFAILFFKIRKRDWDGIEFVVAALGIFGLYTFSHGVYQGARFFFSVFFLLLFFTFNELGKLKIDKKHFWPLVVLILIDSNVGFSGKKIYENFVELKNHSEEELLHRHIDQYRLVEAMERHPSSTTYIYTDRRAESFHLDPHYHLIHFEHSANADYFVLCKNPNEISSEIDHFRYFWIAKASPNLCYNEIKKQSKLTTVLPFAGGDEYIYENLKFLNKPL